MSDDYGFQARRAQGGRSPLCGLVQISQGRRARQQPQPNQPAYPDATPVRLSGDNINAQQPAEELRADGPNQVAQPAPTPPEQPQEQPPEVPQEVPEVPELPREPDQQQPDPTTQPIIDPLTGAPQQQPDDTTGVSRRVGLRTIPPPAPDNIPPFIPPVPGREIFQAYVPVPKKSSRTWGDPSWVEDAVENNEDLTRTSLAPTPVEAYRHIKSAGNYMGLFGPPQASLPAMMASRIAGIITPFMDYISSGAFSPAFGKAQSHALANAQARWKMQKEYMEMQREHMLDLNEQSVRAYRAHVTQAREIYEKYRTGQFNNAPGGAEAELERQLRQWAVNDRDSINALNGGGVKQLENWLDTLDARADEMAVSGRSLRGSDKRRNKAAGGKGEGYTGEDLTTGGGEAKEDVDATGRKIVRDKPLPTKERPSEPSEPSPGEGVESSQDLDAKIGKSLGLNDRGMAYARDLAATGKIGGQTPNSFGQQFKGEKGINTWRKKIGRASCR